MIEINTQIPNEILSIEVQGIDEKGNENTYALKNFSGQNIVLYFYPKDNTPGCTQEACDFRDNFNRITSKATVIGVSPDSVASHKKFQEKHGLNFILLSDSDYKLLKVFNAWGEKKMYGKTFLGVVRSTFIIDKNSVIRNVWQKVRVKGHVDKIIDFISEHL